MNILILQETDWLTRGPHPQHHIFERLSTKPSINITVIDYDIDKMQKSNSIFVKKTIFYNINRTIKNANIKIIRTAHIKVPYLNRITSLISNFFEILKIMRKNRPDIIVGYSITNGFIGLLLSKLYKIPYIFHYIDILHKLVPIPHIEPFARFCSKLILKNSDKILVYTNFQKKFVRKEGATLENITILPNGVSLEYNILNHQKISELKSKYSISEEDFVIFFMGWLYEFAGLKEIIDFYNTDVKNRKLNLKFLILGDGGIYNFLTNYKKEIGADWVILTGKIPYFNLFEYIDLADLCLLSFDINQITREITPIKVIEYMAMKKPVLSNYLPGVISEIGENNGIIFAQNQKDLIKKIGDLYFQSDDLKKIGLIGYEFIKANYSWPKIINKFINLLLETIKKHK